MSKKQKILYAAVGITLLIAGFVSWAAFRPQALNPALEISVRVYHSDETVADFSIKTTAQSLLEVLEDEALIEGYPEDDDFLILSVDGEVADGYNGRYWVCLLDGESMEDPLTERLIEDGDHYTFYTEIY